MKVELNSQSKTCSDGDIQKIIEIFETCKNGTPECAECTDDNGNGSCGFYIGLLFLEKHETDPKLFFQILEIDQKIGWTNPDHVEEVVFYQKGIKIIEDQNVSLKKNEHEKTNIKKFIEIFEQIIVILELAKMAQMARNKFGEVDK